VVLNSDPPVFAGGSVDKAIELVRSDPDARPQFSFFAGCCFWSTKAIQSEIQQGFWIPALAPSRSVFAVLRRTDDFDEWQRDQLLNQSQNQSQGLNVNGEETEDELGAAAAEQGGEDVPVKVPSALGNNSAPVVGEDADGESYAASVHKSSGNSGSDSDSGSDGGSTDAVVPPMDLWSCLLQGLGNDYASISTFPDWLDASKVDALDWK